MLGKNIRGVDMEYSLTLYKNGKLTPRGKKLKKTFNNFEDCKEYLYNYPSKIVKFLAEKADYNKYNLFIFADHNISEPSLSQYSLYRIIIRYMNDNQTCDLIDFLIKISVGTLFDFDSWRRYTTNSAWATAFDPMETIKIYIDSYQKINTIYPISAGDWKDAKYSD